MASRQAGAVRRMYEQWAADLALPPEEREPRETDDHWGDLTAEPRGVDYLEVDAGGVPGMWAVPTGAADGPVLLCWHGGGFAGGSIYTHRKLFGHLAKRAGVRALVASYGHTPVHTYPAQPEQALGTYRWLLGQGAGPVGFAGDSVGGWLALTTALRGPAAGLAPPAAILLISAVTDLTLSGESYQRNAGSDPYFTQPLVRMLVDMFLAGKAAADDPAVNPLRADLAGLPPVYLQVGGAEALLDDSRMFEVRAAEAGVQTRLDVFPEQLHTFQIAAGRAPEADDALDRLAAWVRPKLGLG